ncbi:unnamed protein product [Haemonchus placei]|uniref:Uncharacterized protein n=1 Tax=Haemonchus placei TaxID=6290 RepID=A0A3P8BXA6_HAEPC|nr:unnamed protein product [Haemonchus placei]
MLTQQHHATNWRSCNHAKTRHEKTARELINGLMRRDGMSRAEDSELSMTTPR